MKIREIIINIVNNGYVVEVRRDVHIDSFIYEQPREVVNKVSIELEPFAYPEKMKERLEEELEPKKT